MEGAPAPVERSFRTVKVARKKREGVPNPCPNTSETVGLVSRAAHPITHEQSHFSPLRRTSRQTPSNVWGVGYRETPQTLQAMAERATRRRRERGVA
jgi:hypothetical protein